MLDKARQKYNIAKMSLSPELQEEFAYLDAQRNKLPRHIAIIMDGNGRWAKRKGNNRIAGHQEGVRSVRTIVEAAGELAIEALTLYTFSVENWQRPRWEITALMKLLVTTLAAELDDLMEKNVRLTVSGHLDDLPKDAAAGMRAGIEKTAANTGLNLNLALSYSGRREIISATRNLAKLVKNGDLAPEDIDENIFSRHLLTAPLPDPEFLIRTSGELRLSNFLLWQLAYTEIYVTETLWPDFRRAEFYHALRDFIGRERRFGMVSEQIATT
jgi:undecaprenyl diphosphate synthase